MRLLPSALALSFLLGTAPAIAQTTALAGPAGPQAPEGGAWTDCPVTSVTIHRDRLELKCAGTAGADNPRVFAIESLDRMTDFVLRMALDAKARGKPLSLLYVKSPVANPTGCAVETCRRIVAAESK